MNERKMRGAITERTQTKALRQIKINQKERKLEKPNLAKHNIKRK